MNVPKSLAAVLLLPLLLTACPYGSQPNINTQTALAVACAEYGPLASRTAAEVRAGQFSDAELDQLEAMNESVGAICANQSTVDATTVLPTVRTAVTQLALRRFAE